MKNFPPLREVKVSLNFANEKLPVGRLAREERTFYFAYDGDFIDRGMEILTQSSSNPRK